MRVWPASGLMRMVMSSGNAHDERAVDRVDMAEAGAAASGRRAIDDRPAARLRRLQRDRKRLVGLEFHQDRLHVGIGGALGRRIRGRGAGGTRPPRASSAARDCEKAGGSRVSVLTSLRTGRRRACAASHAGMARRTSATATPVSMGATPRRPVRHMVTQAAPASSSATQSMTMADAKTAKPAGTSTIRARVMATPTAPTSQREDREAAAPERRARRPAVRGRQDCASSQAPTARVSFPAAGRS